MSEDNYEDEDSYEGNQEYVEHASPHGEVAPSIQDMGTIFGRHLTQKQYNYMKGVGFDIVKNARTHRTVEKAVSLLPTNSAIKARIIDMVEPQVDKFRKDYGISTNLAVAFLVMRATTTLTTITNVEDIQLYLARAGFSQFKVKRLSFRVQTSDPSSVEIYVGEELYKGKRKFVNVHGDIYELKMRPSLVNINEDFDLQISLKGAIIAETAAKFEKIGALKSDTEAVVHVIPKRCFDIFKVEKRVASVSDKQPEVSFRETKSYNLMKKYNPGSTNYPLTKMLYESTGYILEFVKAYGVKFREKMDREHGKSPDTIALEALKEADREVFARMPASAKYKALEKIRILNLGATLPSGVMRHLGRTGLLVLTEFEENRVK